jgi:hypothetical protein
LLLGCLELPGRLCRLTQPLDRLHHVLFLCEHGVTEFLGPIELFTHVVQNIGKWHQRFDAGVPRLVLKCRVQLIALELRVCGVLDPPIRFHDFERIGGCHEDLRQQIIGIKSDRREDLVQLFLREDR